jgi:hypothetical protein
MTLKRRRSRAFLHAFSEALRLVALDYANFVSRIELREPDDDPKAFGARHAAARSCLAHLEQLLELLGEDAGLEQVREGFTLLREAKASLGLNGSGRPHRPADEDDDAG